jgi:CRP/FNR family cyclic AMP-dependent transcriptional regulator
MILRNLSSDEMAAVEKTGVLHVYAKGDTIITEGDEGSSFSLILNGRVEVRKSLGADKYKKLVELGPLEIFGEVCFLGVENRSASVLAMEPTQVMEFSKGKLESLIVGRPDIGLKLYREIARELAQRLATVNGDLKDAIVWALGESKHPTVPLVASLRRLSVLPPSGAGAQSKIVVT